MTDDFFKSVISHTTLPPVSVLIPGIELSSDAILRDDSTRRDTGVGGANATAEPTRIVKAAIDFIA
jgi:hypothetical protein